MSRPLEAPHTIVIAGASGFVGTVLCTALAEKYSIRGLSRTPQESTAQVNFPIEWRTCDLYSLLQTEAAVQGASEGIYLVHSMLPAARLAQGTFADFDLLAADNFARAAAHAGLRRIIYVGGIISDTSRNSPHLKSRLEVERVLASHGVPVVTLRCGLVVGAGGSSTRVITTLVRKLPVMLCPSWTDTKSAPIDVNDLVDAVTICLESDSFNTTAQFDLGGPEILNYREMMARTASVLGLRRVMIPVPFLSPKLSRLWVTLMTGAPKSLMKPLVESLSYDMIPTPARALPGFAAKRTFLESLTQLLERESQSTSLPHAFDATGPYRTANLVRSVQRLTTTRPTDAAKIAREYFHWLRSWAGWFLQITLQEDSIQISLRGMQRPLLTFRHSAERSTHDRTLYYIVGGLLARLSKKARLEFRAISDQEFIVAVHDYEPTIPWYAYSSTQAIAHLAVMRAFSHHLKNWSPE